MRSSTRQLKGFLLAALLWLPLAFLGWAVLAKWLAIVPGLGVHWTLTGLWPGIFRSVSVHGADLQVGTTLMVHQGQALGQLLFSLNSMMYGYSLPLLAALVLATPSLTPARRALQWLGALPLLWLAQIFGLASAALRILVFSAGAQGAASAASAGLSANAVALAYQFGYLILPAVLPVVLWVLMNRRFLEALGQSNGEPASP